MLYVEKDSFAFQSNGQGPAAIRLGMSKCECLPSPRHRIALA